MRNLLPIATLFISITQAGVVPGADPGVTAVRVDVDPSTGLPTGFETVIAGTERVLGPFAERRSAEEAWRNLSEAHRSQCLMRFSIAAERA